MKFKDFLYNELKDKIENPDVLPKGFQEIGKIMLIRLKPEHLKYKKQIVDTIYKKYKRPVGVIYSIEGELRIPKIEVFYGSPETIKKELGCRFLLDVTKVMYAKGNSGEKERMLKIVDDGEKILDMFAGIGYFSVIIAKHKKKCLIYSIEKNLDSYRFLIRNIYLNNIKNIFPFFGDNREIISKLNEKFDRILMGYVPSSVEFLPYALKVSKKGTVIHLHQCLTKKEFDPFTKKIEKEFGLNLIGFNKVKSYAPHVYHWVLDFEKP